MDFEKFFERIGEQVDNSFESAQKAIKDIKKKTVTSINDAETKIQKNLNKGFSKKNISDKTLSDFETAMANLAINIAHGLEGTYKKISKTLFCSQEELNTEYGKLGSVYGKYNVLKVEAYACRAYLKEIDKKIPSTVHLKSDILKDAVATLSSNNTKLFGYYLYGYLLKKIIPENIEEKKKLIKKYLLTTEEKHEYDVVENQEKKRRDKNQRKNEG